MLTFAPDLIIQSMISVTKPFLPSREEYSKYIDKIWSNNWLTNNGPLVNELESKLKEKLKVDNLLFLANGTIAIQLAIKALHLKGKIITTPFSYIATTSSILWENCEPVFVDIDKEEWNINCDDIEKHIDESTVAILATHVFGNSCRVDKISAISKKFNLKVIYDAAHAFGVTYDNHPISTYGDVSTLSFHATKLFHTIEGGAAISNDLEVHERIKMMRNFGHNGPDKIDEIGINGKNSEFHAAMGLCVLSQFDDIQKQRKAQYLYYLENLEGSNLEFQKLVEKMEYNYSYFPILFESEKILIKAVYELNRKNIFPRRYFHPSLNKISIIKNSCDMPISEDISTRILCLPLYHNLSKSVQKLICDIIKNEI